MKESISYSFLLNIIILFIFVCAAIVTGIFSYYRAFRAGTIIVNEIEKYEGFNCVSQESIAKKLSGVSYNLPFNIHCKEGEDNCITDEGYNYKVFSYNLDNNLSDSYDMVEKIEVGDSSYTAAVSTNCYADFNGMPLCKMSSEYQYGVYTYMYTNLPIVSGFLRIPIYNKTKKMYDQRNLYGNESYSKGSEGQYFIIDLDSIPNRYLDTYSGYGYVITVEKYSYLVNKNYTAAVISHKKKYNEEITMYGYGIRNDMNYLNLDGKLRELFKLSDSSESQSLLTDKKKKCGTITDWSLF